MLAHSPILCPCCAPCLYDSDELMLFFSTDFGMIVRVPFGKKTPRSRSVSISVFYSLLALKWARRCSRSVQKQPVLLACCCFGSAETYHGLSCSLSVYDSLNDNYTAPFSFFCPVLHNRIGLLVSCLLSFPHTSSALFTGIRPMKPLRTTSAPSVRSRTRS